MIKAIKYKKNDSCNIIKKFSPEFIKMINNTKKDGQERAIGFCPSDGDVTLSAVCTGTECNIPLHSIESKMVCENKKSVVATLHTHPGIGEKYGEMSDNDVLYAGISDHKFSCIGYSKPEETIICYNHPYGVSKDIIDEAKSENFISRFNKLMDDLHSHGVEITSGTYVPKFNSNKERWNQLMKENISLNDSREKFMTRVNSPISIKKRIENSCKIFLSNK